MDVAGVGGRVWGGIVLLDDGILPNKSRVSGRVVIKEAESVGENVGPGVVVVITGDVRW